MKHTFGLITATLISCAAFAQETTANATWILDHTETFADFPQPGILFRSITPLLKNPEAFKKATAEFANRYRSMNIDAIAGLDSRGFIFGAALAYEMNLPFVLIRKPGKLPGDLEKISYSLEYGSASFEIEKSSLKPGQRVLVIDDVLATGGTASAACELVERLGAEVVEVACMIELSVLKGREKIGRPVFSLIAIEPEQK